MQISRMDALEDFGTLTLSSGTEFTNVLEKDSADIKRMRVVAEVTTAAEGGTSVTLTLFGSDDNSTFVELESTPAIALASLTKGATFSIGVPDNASYKYYKVVATKSGTFTAGVMAAQLDTYMGV